MKLRIGTRGSRLALWQAHRVAECLAAARPEVETEIVQIESTGDRDKSTSLAGLGTVGIFTREIEAALDDNRTDIAVHSLKDMPASDVLKRKGRKLVIVAVPRRGDYRDCFIGSEAQRFEDLPNFGMPDDDFSLLWGEQAF